MRKKERESSRLGDGRTDHALLIFGAEGQKEPSQVSRSVGRSLGRPPISALCVACPFPNLISKQKRKKEKRKADFFFATETNFAFAKMSGMIFRVLLRTIAIEFFCEESKAEQSKSVAVTPAGRKTIIGVYCRARKKDRKSFVRSFVRPFTCSVNNFA